MGRKKPRQGWVISSEALGARNLKAKGKGKTIRVIIDWIKSRDLSNIGARKKGGKEGA